MGGWTNCESAGGLAHGVLPVFTRHVLPVLSSTTGGTLEGTAEEVQGELESNKEELAGSTCVFNNAHVDMLLTARKIVATTAVFASDGRRKIIEGPLGDGYLAKLCELEPVLFNWTDGDEAGRKDVGIIAQRVKEVFGVSSTPPTSPTRVPSRTMHAQAHLPPDTHGAGH
mmetsp:Transcript_87901/g.250640  ORF Transcript_87901/g.250640 Transcript_87901/m.250640 type:complete len:170 (+) Transcript_87901:492-1001(+)